MLFPYTYVPHSMEKMQEFIDFIFFEVWCKAPGNEYGIHLFEPLDSLYHIINELNRKDFSGKLKDGAGKWFYESLNEIFNEFKTLNRAEIDEYCQYYQMNNQIEELCSNNHEASPVQYANLNSSKDELNKKLADFFSKLYSSGFFELSFVAKTLGSNLSSYYNDFVKVNNLGYCPFCGLLPIDSEFDPTREAFDHYLPKSKYPFNSVNLKNLAPSCYKCNSSNKKDKDPLHDKSGNRRKAFYPFSDKNIDLQLTVNMLSNDWMNLAPDHFQIIISSSSHSDEVETWNDLFQIGKRYSAKCCHNTGGKYWLSRIFEESENYNLSIKGMLDAEIKSAETAPWINSQFLQKAFLEGCERVGLFQDQLIQ